MYKSNSTRGARARERFGATAILAVAFTWTCTQSTSAPAQPAPELRNDKISIDYYEPRDERFLDLYKTLQNRRVLEELSQFLAPVQWTKKFRIMIKECPAGTPQPEVFYSPVEYSLSICYQWFTFLHDLNPQPRFATKQQVIVGGLVGMVLHESARAAFDMLNIPVLGSEEDAADQVSAFIALQFSPEVAQTVIKGTYSVWKKYDDDITSPLKNRQYNFASAASVPRQRMYNILCIAYGGARSSFGDLVEQGDLLPERVENCADEYSQILFAFDKTINPKVNSELMKQVRSITWISPEDLKVK
jgi:hypothetical protein